MKLKIKNFMCHEDVEIDLKGFSMLSGPNGSGKSAVFHAITWLIEGGTNNFITEGKKSCEVTLKIGDNEITRFVDNSETKVIINGKVVSNNKDSLQQIGIDIDMDFYNQFDSVYLLSETPTTRAEVLNNVFNIEKIENILKDVNKELRDTKSSKKESEQRLEKEKNMLEAYKSSLINERIIRAIKNLNNQYENLKDYIDINVPNTPNKIAKDSFDLLGMLEAYNEIKIENTPNKIKDKISILANLKTLMEDFMRINSKLTIAKVIEGFNTEDFVSIVDKLKVVDKYNCLSEELKKDGVNIASKNIELEALEKKLKGKVCPTCGNKV